MRLPVLDKSVLVHEHALHFFDLPLVEYLYLARTFVISALGDVDFLSERVNICEFILGSCDIYSFFSNLKFKVLLIVFRDLSSHYGRFKLNHFILVFNELIL